MRPVTTEESTFGKPRLERNIFFWGSPPPKNNLTNASLDVKHRSKGQEFRANNFKERRKCPGAFFWPLKKKLTNGNSEAGVRMAPARAFSLIGLAALAIVLPLPPSSFTLAYSFRGFCVAPCPLSLRSAPRREPNGVFSASPKNARIRPMHMQHSSPSYVPVPVDPEVASIFASALSGQFSNAIQVEECARKSA
jgi:hypothetical protein